MWPSLGTRWLDVRGTILPPSTTIRTATTAGRPCGTAPERGDTMLMVAVVDGRNTDGPGFTTKGTAVAAHRHPPARIASPVPWALRTPRLGGDSSAQAQMPSGHARRNR